MSATQTLPSDAAAANDEDEVKGCSLSKDIYRPHNLKDHGKALVLTSVIPRRFP